LKIDPGVKVEVLNMSGDWTEWMGWTYPPIGWELRMVHITYMDGHHEHVVRRFPVLDPREDVMQGKRVIGRHLASKP